MELRCLRNFVATAEALSFRKAAESQFISQPALSRQIASLEIELGVELFSRTGRGVRLTKAGRVLLDEAKRLLEDADRAFAAVRKAPANGGSTIAIGFSADATAARVADLLADLRLDYPEIAIRLCDGTGGRLEELVALGELDVAVVYLPSSVRHECTVTECWDVDLVLLVPSGHPAVGSDRSSISAFSRSTFLVPTAEIGKANRERLVHYCTDAGFDPTLDEDHSVAGIKVAVAAGRGVGFIPKCEAGELPRGTEVISLVLQPPPGVVGMVWNRTNHSQVLQRVISLATGGAAAVVSEMPALHEVVEPAYDLAVA